MLRSIFLMFILFMCNLGFGQTLEYDIEKRFTVAELESDFKILSSALKEIHPSLYSFISKADFENLINTTSAEISNDLTELEFHILVRKLIRGIRCGHTMAKPSSKWYDLQKKDSKLLPFDIILLNDKIFIKESYDNDSKLEPGIEILSIDDVSIHEIIKSMKSIQEVDGIATSFENKKIEKYFRTYYLFLYGRANQYEIEYLDKGNNKSKVTIKGGLSKTINNVSSTSNNAIQKMSGANLFIDEKQKNLAVLDINGFSSKGYKKFYKTVFKEIEQKGINHFVLDLRGNGGGYFPNGNQLLSYLLEEEFFMDFSHAKKKIKKQPYLKMPIVSKLTSRLFKLIPDKIKDDPNRNYAIRYKPKKKNPYKGNLYVLIDGATFSMSSFVATKLKHHRNCIILGKETGGGEIGSNAILIYNLTLPATKIRVNIPYYFLDHDVELNMVGRGVMPDIEISYELKEILQKEDKEMEKVKLLINQ